MTSGDYGTGTNTTAVSIPFIVRRLFAKGDVGLDIPFESVTGNGTVTFLGGTPNRLGTMSSNAQTGTGNLSMSPAARIMQPPPNRPGQTRTSGVFPGREINSGLGDLVLNGHYQLLEDSEYVPSADLTGRIKFPTADRDKGLGTGEFDEGVGMDFSKDLLRKFSALAGVGYTFVGNPPGEALRDQWDYNVGLGYDFAKFLFGSLTYEEYRALVAGGSNPSDLNVSGSYKLTSRWCLAASAQIGLSDGAPDFGLSAGISTRF